MNGTRSYDADLRMFREAAKPVNVAHLRFLRWLVEHGKLDSPPAGPSSGSFAESLASPAVEAA